MVSAPPPSPTNLAPSHLAPASLAPMARLADQVRSPEFLTDLGQALEA